MSGEARPDRGRRLSPGGQQFRGDDGSADARVTAALAAYSAGAGSEHTALTALAAARLLVPVVSVLTEAGEHGGGEHGGDKSSEMAMPTLIGNDGRSAIIAFTSLDALSRWRQDARPVPAEAARVWRAAVADGCAVVIDVAGPVPLAVEGARLAALAAGRPVPHPYQDPDVLAEVETVVAGHPAITGARLAPGGADLSIQFLVTPGALDWEQAVRHAAEQISARLGPRLSRGVEISAAAG